MGDIARGIKTYGTRTFVGERAAAPGNKAPILSAEVDYDLDLLYTTWNNGITIVDLAPGFVIDHAHLGTDAVESNNIKNGTITLADMGSNSVDSSKIVNGSIRGEDLDPSIVLPPGAIQPNSIGPSQLIDPVTGPFVTENGNITPGATVKDQQIIGTDVDEGTLITRNVETIIAERTWTTRGGFWIAWGFVNGAVLVSNPPANDVTARLRLGATGAGNIAGSTVVQKHMIHLSASQPDPINIFVPYTAALLHGTALTAQAAARLQVTVHYTSGQLLIASTRLVVMEQA
jgi:hypothetical protein